MRHLILCLFTFCLIGGEVPLPPGMGHQAHGMWGNIQSMQRHVIDPAREALQWLAENPAFPNIEEWRTIIIINEINYLHKSLLIAVDTGNNELGQVIMGRIREHIPDVNRRINMRNPTQLREERNFLRLINPDYVTRRDRMASFNYDVGRPILNMKASGLRFRTPAEAAAGGVIPRDQIPAGTEFLDDPPTDFLGNPVTPTTSRR